MFCNACAIYYVLTYVFVLCYNIPMYTGDEKLHSENVLLPFSVSDFWRWGYSNLNERLIRGTFAEFIVKCALESGGVHADNDAMTGTAEYDLNGPPLGNGSPARIEVKSTASASFSIRPARVLVDGDYKMDSPQQRNNNLYVFCVFRDSTDPDAILDMANWSFYVVPTSAIDSDAVLSLQKSISLSRVRSLASPQTFDSLCAEIKSVCAAI